MGSARKAKSQAVVFHQRPEQPTIQKTKPLAENLNANLPAFAKKSKLFVAKYLKALNCPTFTYYNVRT